MVTKCTIDFNLSSYFMEESTIEQDLDYWKGILLFNNALDLDEKMLDLNSSVSKFPS